jgi:hypothetical protein
VFSRSYGPISPAVAVDFAASQVEAEARAIILLSMYREKGARPVGGLTSCRTAIFGSFDRESTRLALG